MKNDWLALASILAPQLDAAAREGLVDGGRRVGEWRAWRADGSLLVSAWFDRGRRHGDWTRWHPNGSPQLLVPYVAGHAKGTLLAWYVGGMLALRVDLEEGELHGACQVWRSDATPWARGLFRRGELVQFVRMPPKGAPSTLPPPAWVPRRPARHVGAAAEGA